jgi:hypothetical protein
MEGNNMSDMTSLFSFLHTTREEARTEKEIKKEYELYTEKEIEDEETFSVLALLLKEKETLALIRDQDEFSVLRMTDGKITERIHVE